MFADGEQTERVDRVQVRAVQRDGEGVESMAIPSRGNGRASGPVRGRRRTAVLEHLPFLRTSVLRHGQGGRVARARRAPELQSVGAAAHHARVAVDFGVHGLRVRRARRRRRRRPSGRHTLLRRLQDMGRGTTDPFGAAQDVGGRPGGS